MSDSPKDWWASENAIVDEETMARICCMEETIHAVENTSETLLQWQYRSLSFIWDMISVSDDPTMDNLISTKSLHDLIPLVKQIIEARSDPAPNSGANSVSLVDQEQMYMACLGILSAVSARGHCNLVNLPLLISQLKINDPMLRLADDARTMITGILFNVALMSKNGLEEIAKLVSGCDLSALLDGANRHLVDRLGALLLGGGTSTEK